ncbi:MAG: DUF4870 domain-containing protein [Halobacteria archaeon]|nr:DUF4870 domain-containing protein [Halobacteria archaeon]
MTQSDDNRDEDDENESEREENEIEVETDADTDTEDENEYEHDPDEITDDEKTWGVLAHLSMFAGLVIPFGNIFGPLAVWLIKGEESEFVAAHAKESLNFQISMTIYTTIAALSILILVGIVLLPILLLANPIMAIIATLKASEKEMYEYPLTIRIV